MVGPLLRSLWSTTRRSFSSSSPPSRYSQIKPLSYARAFSTANATAAAADVAPGGALDPGRLRNVAVIAHVDHGKTTLMDRLLRQCGADIPHERALDSIDLERERGITIASKVTSISWKDKELNMVDTPGHADFGGEVERVVGMVEGAVLVVDAGEGPLAQTKFVLAKALKYGLRPILLLNKVDKPAVTEERCNEVESLVFDLFANLGASEEQLDFPVLYASAKEGWASSTYTKSPPDVKDMSQLLDAIVGHVPPPSASLDAPFQMLVSMMEKDPYLGRVLTGRVTCGVVRVGDKVQGLKNTDDGTVKIDEGKIVKLMKKKGMRADPVDSAGAGDIVSMAGLSSPTIGHTVANAEVTTALPTVVLDPPTISMTFGVNDSPLAGSDGIHLTGGKIGDRLLAESETNLAINVLPSTSESYEVQGRGELQLGILIENMRREGFELSVSPPKVMYKVEKGAKLEPIEEVTIEVDDEHVGLVMEALSHRRGEVTDMGPVPGNMGRTRMCLTCPSRGLVGYRSVFSSDTRGSGFMHRAFLKSSPKMATSSSSRLVRAVGRSLFSGLCNNSDSLMRSTHEMCNHLFLQQQRTFIQMRTSLKVVDNSGAKRVACIQALKCKKGARLGDKIVCSVKEAQPGGKVKKGEVHYGVVVRAAMPKGRCDGSEVKFDDNAVVLLNKQGEPIGTRVFGPVPHELRKKNHSKILSLAEYIV